MSTTSTRQTVLYERRHDRSHDTSPPPAERSRPRVAFGLLTSIMLVLLASCERADAPVCDLPGRMGVLSAITITVIFGVYAVAVLMSLLVFGALSDHIGRRPVLIASLAMQVGRDGGVRVRGQRRCAAGSRACCRGVATGLAVGAIGAGLVDLHPGPRSGRQRGGGDERNRVRRARVGAVRPAAAVAHPCWCTWSCWLLFAAAGDGDSAHRRDLGAQARCAGVRCGRPSPCRHAWRGTLAIAAPSLVAVWALAGFYLFPRHGRWPAGRGHALGDPRRCGGVRARSQWRRDSRRVPTPRPKDVLDHRQLRW